jgi:acetyltransferase-like isoleucine patch superfamily enzyme
MLALLLQPYVLRLRHRRNGLRVGHFSVCEDVQFGRWNTIHNLVRMRSVMIGDMSYVANGARIVNARIGRYCSLGPQCRVGMGVHPTAFASTHPAFYSRTLGPNRSLAVQEFVDSITVEIGNDVWIGDRASIMDGVRIGDGAIVGANALVTRDVPPYAIVGGVPARLIRMRFDDTLIARLLATRWWDRDHDWVRRNANAFADPRRLVELLESAA